MQLCDVRNILPGARAVNMRDAKVVSITQDSRCVTEGSLFVAIDGTDADGHEFIGDALRGGACAFVCRRSVPEAQSAHPHFVVDDTHAALSALAAAFYGNPSREITCIGVTGTDGKTSVTTMIRGLLDECGGAGMTSTVSYSYGKRSIRADRTTPDAVTIQGFLADMVTEGLRYAVIETSSHALVQKRVADVDFSMAVFTNLSPEHLDYHPTMDDYRDAKAILFESLPANGYAVLNAADPASSHLEEVTGARVLRYGPGGDIEADIIECAVGRTVVRVAGMGMDLEVRLGLTGRHNVQNVLAACCAARALGMEPDRVGALLERFEPVVGRLQVIKTGLACTVLVDYAHTPRALRSVLEELKGLAGEKLIVVFGCGGDRDTTKRPLMGRAAEETADDVWVTSDNPRTEEPGAIIDEILAGMARPGSVHVEPDRAAAIRGALASASAGDIVLVAGKGHEKFQVIGGTTIPFEDGEAIRSASAEILGKTDASAVCTRN